MCADNTDDANVMANFNSCHGFALAGKSGQVLLDTDLGADGGTPDETFLKHKTPIRLNFQDLPDGLHEFLGTSG